MPGCSASACNRCERLRLNSPLCMPRRETVRESRMREICMSGLTRERATVRQGIRMLSHVRGNPDTDVGRSLNLNCPFSTLPVNLPTDLKRRQRPRVDVHDRLGTKPEN